jgi:hypothetical protein
MEKRPDLPPGAKRKVEETEAVVEEVQGDDHGGLRTGCRSRSETKNLLDAAAESRRYERSAQQQSREDSDTRIETSGRGSAAPRTRKRRESARAQDHTPTR